MEQIAIEFAPLTRRTDPQTSHDAAEKAAHRLCTDEAICFAVISDMQEYGATAKDIDRYSTLDDVQANRRLSAMGKRGLIHRRLVANPRNDGDFQRREGCAIWWKS